MSCQGPIGTGLACLLRATIANHDEEVEHQPIAEPSADYTCLVVDTKLTFRGRLMRTLQSLFGL